MTLSNRGIALATAALQVAAANRAARAEGTTSTRAMPPRHKAKTTTQRPARPAAKLG